MKFKTLQDVELVLFSSEKFRGLSLRGIHGLGAGNMIKEIHYLHLLNINSRGGKKIKFDLVFKEFLSEQVGVSMRTVCGWMKKLVELTKF